MLRKTFPDEIRKIGCVINAWHTLFVYQIT